MAFSGEPLQRDRYVILAKLARLVKAYDDMRSFTDNIVDKRDPGGLNVEEMQLFEFAYNAVMKRLVDALKTLSTLESEAKFSAETMSESALHAGSKRKRMTREDIMAIAFKVYRQDVEKQFNEIYDSVIDTLDNVLIPSTGSSESTVFYHKMKGYCNCFLAEVKKGTEDQTAIERAEQSFSIAWKIAQVELPRSHGLRIAVAIGYSEFLYEMKKSTVEACHIAQQALNTAENNIDPGNEGDMALFKNLQNTLTKWLSTEPNN